MFLIPFWALSKYAKGCYFWNAKICWYPNTLASNTLQYMKLISTSRPIEFPCHASRKRAIQRLYKIIHIPTGLLNCQQKLPTTPPNPPLFSSTIPFINAWCSMQSNYFYVYHSKFLSYFVMARNTVLKPKRLKGEKALLKKAVQQAVLLKRWAKGTQFFALLWSHVLLC